MNDKTKLTLIENYAKGLLEWGFSHESEDGWNPGESIGSNARACYKAGKEQMAFNVGTLLLKVINEEI